MIDKSKVNSLLNSYKQNGKYRVFNDIVRERGQFPKALWYGPYSIKNIVNWCSNDYLGMGQNKVVIDAMHTALDQTGSGSGGTRNIGGTSHYHVALEHEIAKLHNKASALLFTSAYVANEWSLIALSKIVDDICFLSDSKNHNSLIMGMVHSKKPKHVFQHNDMEQLEELCASTRLAGQTPCIVFESVYSMDGDVGHIKQICDIADRYDAITFIDEVHAVGLYGESGGGWTEKLGLQSRVDIINGTLGKAYGMQGGYIAGDADVLDAIRSVAAGFIFTTSLSPVICAGALASIKYLKDHNELRIKHQERANALKQHLREKELPLMECSTTHIVPVMVGDAVKCKQMSDELLNEYGIYVQPINSPTVEEGTERLRFAPTPYHDDQLTWHLVESLEKLFRK
jgi:5-aminolevulinate synthase